MRHYTPSWSIMLADGWASEPDPQCETFLHANGVGALQISCAHKPELVTDEDLYDFVDSQDVAAVVIGAFTGIHRQFVDGDHFWRMWWLRSGTQMLLITYNCFAKNQGQEDSVIDDMLQSLQPEHGRWRQ